MEEEIQKALEVLQNGGVILYPTDTIWGIGCDAGNASAVQRIFEIKKRPERKSMLLLLDRFNQLRKYLDYIPAEARPFVKQRAQPTTIIYPDAKNLPDQLLGSEKTIGVRLTDDPFCKQLIKKLNSALVSTSANFSGQPSPANFSEIDEELKKQVDYVVNWRQDETEPRQPSQVVSIDRNGQLTLLRG